MTAPQAVPLSELLRLRSAPLHAEAERSGIVREILRGTASRRGYALFMRNLLPGYQALEAGLDEHRTHPAAGPFARPELYRSAAIAADLSELEGADWQAHLALLPAGTAYAARIAHAAAIDPGLLLAHAYTRYLGDLSGARFLHRALVRTLALPATSLSFYDFPAIDDSAAYKAAYRLALDRAGPLLRNPDAVAEEARHAFGANIAVSKASLAAAEA